MNWKELPEAFLAQQQRLLGEEYPHYLEALSKPWSRGLRVNTWKLSPERFLGLCPVPVEPIPWIPNGFFLDALPSGQGAEPNDASWIPSKDPYYYAGLYYLQEPSAMTPAAFLPVKPGDRVLDLCAAPGGKATELGAKLRGKGLLFANDISNSRAKGLLKNLELFGIPNACVTSEPPETLARSLPEFFDCILVDAPCSGEGMFRREPGMVKDWLERGPEHYGPIQQEILAQAVTMLRPGGYLLYSTCTFSTLEDEENVSYVLAQFPQMALEPLPAIFGAAVEAGMPGLLRLFPHRVRGEGHFLALFRKACQDPRDGERKDDKERLSPALPHRRGFSSGEEDLAGFFSFMEETSFHLDYSRILRKGENLFYLPEDFPEGLRLRYLRTGLWLGTVKRSRFEPSQALAMALRPEEYPRVIRFSHEDERVIRYLKGETLALKEEELQENGCQGKAGKGNLQKEASWRLVCVEDFPLGWAKEERGKLKNKYYPGWRYS